MHGKKAIKQALANQEKVSDVVKQKADDNRSRLEDAEKGVSNSEERLSGFDDRPPLLYGTHLKGNPFVENATGKDYAEPLEYDDYVAIHKYIRRETKGQTYQHHGGGAPRQIFGAHHVEDHDDLTLMAFHNMMTDSAGGISNPQLADRFTQWAKDQGYDGLEHAGGWNVGTKEHDVWIAFEPNQIKATNAKDFDASDNNIYKGMKSLQERDLAILIPEPPSEMQRVSELSKVSDQYRNRKCPEQMQDVLDSDMDSLFNALLMDAGLPSSMYMITGISRSIVAPIKIHKEYYGAMRPNVLAARHGVDFEYDHLESAQTPSYPSGHTTQAAYLAKVLGSIYPEIQSKLDKLASQIAESRIDRGVHLPSDNEAGRQLAQALFEKTNKQMRTGDVRYQEVFGG